MSTQAINVLVTAVGGDLGQAVVKSLRLGQRNYQVHGADMQMGSGILFVDELHTLPRADDDGYVLALEALCGKHAIHAVIPSSEPEIRRLCNGAAHPALACGTRIISQPKAVIETHGDKLRSFEYLRSAVQLADFVNAQDKAAAEHFIADHGFPVCMKERVSSGRRGVRILNSADEFAYEWPRFSEPVIQELIDGENREYSVGVFVHGEDVRLISYRRKLERLGCSWFAELDQHPEVLGYCLKVAQAAKVQGSINVQLRISQKGPLLLEINPRFSSLAAARAACGFNDVEWSVLQALSMEVPDAPPTPPHFCYHRYIAEAVDFGDGKSLHLPQAWAPKIG